MFLKFSPDHFPKVPKNTCSYSWISPRKNHRFGFKNKIKDSSIYEDFIFYGHKNNALDYLNAADLIIHPSRGEALPRVILEAMALGGTIIASDIDGHKELIRHEKTGLLFDLKNPGQLCHLVKNLFNDRKMAQRLGVSAKNYCYENYGEANMEKSIRKLFDNILLSWW